MGRLPIVLLIFFSILLVQCQENALDNSAKNALDRNREKGGIKSDSPPDFSRLQRTCSSQECKEKELNDMLDSIISSEAATETEPAKVPPKKDPPRPSPPHHGRRPNIKGHILHDIVSWVENTKRAIFGFGYHS